MKVEFLAFLKSPGVETYLAVRTELVCSEAYDPYSIELVEAEKLLAAKKLREAGRLVAGSMPNLLLSPRAHLTLAYISSREDDEKDAEGEGMIASLLADAILATGDGSEARPYLVVRSTDEYDVLQYLGKEPTGQAAHRREKQHLDCIACADGTSVWFDITDARAMLEGGSDEGRDG